MEEITIERIILEEIEVLPPPGLSELLSIKSSWRRKTSEKPESHYEGNVTRRNGNFITYLSPKVRSKTK
jgi:hypothetical protein